MLAQVAGMDRQSAVSLHGEDNYQGLRLFAVQSRPYELVRNWCRAEVQK